jgi:hypothetical protein
MLLDVYYFDSQVSSIYMFLPLAATVLKTKVEVGIFQYQRNLLISSDRLVFLESHLKGQKLMWHINCEISPANLSPED